MNSTAASVTGLSPRSPASSRRVTFADELIPRLLPGRDQLRPAVELRHDALEGDAVQRGVLQHEPAERDGADVDEVGDRIVRLDELPDLGEENDEGLLRERVDEEALLRSEEAVDRAGRGPGRVCHGADGERCRPTLGHEALRGRPQRRAGLLVVLTWSPHALTL